MFYAGYDEISPDIAVFETEEERDAWVNDKDAMFPRVVFDDGDTLAEADYREAVAHCLDPVGVNASTADLIDQDTCAISIVKEEKARRSAKKIMDIIDDFVEGRPVILRTLDAIHQKSGTSFQMKSKKKLGKLKTS